MELTNDIDKTLTIDLKNIVPNRYQPRQTFNQIKLTELAQSIREQGLIQSIIVRPLGDKYELIVGERRVQAAKLAGQTTISAVIRDYSEAMLAEIALVENIQRDNLNPIDEANSFRKLIAEFGYSENHLAQRVGKSLPTISNSLRLLNLAPAVQEYLVTEKLTVGLARPLLAIKDPLLQKKVADEIIEKKMNARQVETLVKNFSEKKSTNITGKSSPWNVYVQDWQQNFSRTIGSKVNITGTNNRGKIEIDFYSPKDLERIVEMLEQIK